MSANDSFEWIFNQFGSNLGSNLQNDTLSFRKTYDNSRLIDDIGNYYNVHSNDYQSIIYTDLEPILHGNSFTLSLTLSEIFDDISKSGNLFTLGYHTRGSKNTCITVGRKAATGEVVLGTINDLITLKGNSLSTSNIIQSDLSYNYIVVHNNLEKAQNQFNLFIKEPTNTYSLISDSSGLTNISILQPKLFIGSSLWTNEPEWNNQFDLCDVTLTSNIQLTVGKTIYPVDILSNPISESNLTNPDTTEIQIDEQFLIKLFSRIRFSKSSVKVYVTSTTDVDKLLECVNFVVNGIENYEYHFTGIVDNDYSNDTNITYLFDLNGTTSSYTSSLIVNTEITWFGEWVLPFTTRLNEIDVAFTINITEEEHDIDEETAFESPNTSRYTIDAINNEINANSEIHALTTDEFYLPMRVECELKLQDSKNSSLTALLVTNETRSTDTNMHTHSQSVLWGTGIGSNRNKYYRRAGTHGVIGVQDDLRTNWTLFTIDISVNTVNFYQNDILKYSVTRDQGTFPSWLVSGGKARIGFYSGGGKSYFRNFKVIDNANKLGYDLEYSSDDITWNSVSLLNTDRSYTLTGLSPDTSYKIRLTDLDDTNEVSSLKVATTKYIARTEFISSNRDSVNEKIKTKFRINSARTNYTIESVCYEARQSDYATSATLFDVTMGTDSYSVTETGANDVIVSTPYSFTMDDTTSQWVYYRFAGYTQVYEIEIEDIYRYGWVVASSKWANDIYTDSVQLSALYVFAHEPDTTVIVTHSDNTITVHHLEPQWAITSNNAIFDSTKPPVKSIRANKPIQLGGNVWHERYFINISVRDTNYLIAPFGFNSKHDHEIYIHQDNTTVQYTDTDDYQIDGTFQTITYPTKGLYTMQWGNSTELRTVDYQYRNLKGVSSTNTSYLRGGMKIIKADKPVSGHQQGNNYHTIQWMSPVKNEPTLAIRWRDIIFAGWWSFDNDSISDTNYTFNVRTTGQTTHTFDATKYQPSTGLNNWPGTSSDTSSGYLISKADTVPSDIYFMVCSAKDGAGGEAGMSVPLSYSSTAYVQIISNSGGDLDPTFVYSFDDGTQSLENVTIHADTREIESTTQTFSSDFTSDYASGLGGVRHYPNTLAPSTNTVYRTSSANTYIGAYVNSSSDKEEWILGNIPNVNALLFTPLE